MRTTALSVLAILLLLSVYSCDEEEPIPAYVNVTAADLVADEITYGSNSSKITDVWVSEDENFIGVYELPASIPVLSQGETQILLYPGVKQGGIHSDRRIYPFYTAYSIDLNLEPNQDANVSPIFSYQEGKGLFLMDANFEVASEMESKVEGSNLIINSNNAKVFEGSRSAQVIPELEEGTWRIETIDRWEVDLSRSTWLEFNYKTNEPMQLVIIVSAQVAGSTQFINTPFIYLTINPQEDWNKMYVEISEIIVEAVEVFGSTAENYSFSVSFQGQSEDPTNAEYLLDNVKIITTL